MGNCDKRDSRLRPYLVRSGVYQKKAGSVIPRSTVAIRTRFNRLVPLHLPTGTIILPPRPTGRTPDFEDMSAFPRPRTWRVCRTAASRRAVCLLEGPIVEGLAIDWGQRREWWGASSGISSRISCAAGRGRGRVSICLSDFSLGPTISIFWPFADVTKQSPFGFSVRRKCPLALQ